MPEKDQPLASSPLISAYTASSTAPFSSRGNSSSSFFSGTSRPTLLSTVFREEQST